MVGTIIKPEPGGWLVPALVKKNYLEHSLKSKNAG